MFGLELFDTTRELAARWIVERAARGERTQVAFVNAHCVNVMYRDAAYRGVARHLRDEVQIESNQRRSQTHAGGSHRGLAPGMASPHDSDLVFFNKAHI